jgi:hypothetical protein
MSFGDYQEIMQEFAEAARMGRRRSDPFTIWAMWSAREAASKQGRNARHYEKHRAKHRANARVRMAAKAKRTACLWCGTIYGARKEDSVYCGNRCKAAAWRATPEGQAHLAMKKQEWLAKSAERRRASYARDRAAHPHAPGESPRASRSAMTAQSSADSPPETTSTRRTSSRAA